MSTKIKILDKKQIQQKIDRIAYQILEDNFEEKEIVLAGIIPRGNTLAERLKKKIESIGELKVKLVNIELKKDSSSLEAKTDVAIEECIDKVIVVVDDVLNSGRTLVYGLGIFLNIPTKKVRTVVLVDRSHKLFPIHTDFVGLELSTVAQEHIDVVLGVEGQEDAVYLV
ncbi:phosphoribosyltransferase family protein [Solitalea canadensis]|uniref:Pyrimidine operon attenuation protein/uracil phosphoribosyltransferase n=1 Tax=Solitalea canadensis (strain ATCC 29591 / DSM 3403 / JCM 21819 / LMG 8368 / NBRC 15130 / NCIMB 12057 / USAM 9D) TaxID=929556 RepID=H8KN69_SOLCM|nr:phosphoribosyltransferase family protein [Solitalea canadensis]AFD09402.1 pyrimidine operon attenuation protein/uracil phosphoribosyltransferase [Solitalea canadensis DSM 3403]